MKLQKTSHNLMLTQLSIFAVSISCRRPISSMPVRPQYMPLIQKCSVATCSSLSAACNAWQGIVCVAAARDICVGQAVWWCRRNMCRQRRARGRAAGMTCIAAFAAYAHSSVLLPTGVGALLHAS
jgi:hypothetical protein